MFSFVSRSCTHHSAPARFVRSVPVGPPPDLSFRVASLDREGARAPRALRRAAALRVRVTVAGVEECWSSPVAVGSGGAALSFDWSASVAAAAGGALEAALRVVVGGGGAAADDAGGVVRFALCALDAAGRTAAEAAEAEGRAPDATGGDAAAGTEVGAATASLRALLGMPQSVGMIGGRPRRSYYFLGCQGERVPYLDPHEVQPALRADAPQLPSCHFAQPPRTMPMREIDPSLALGFLCPTAAAFDDLCARCADAFAGSLPAFSIATAPPDFSRLSGGEEEGESGDDDGGVVL